METFCEDYGMHVDCGCYAYNVILCLTQKPIGCISRSTSVCCCRNLQPGESKLKDNEEALLDSICKAYFLPKWCSINDYEKLFKANGLQGIKTADWSEEVAPFWRAVIKSALSAQGFMGLFRAGITTIKVGMTVRCVQMELSCKPVLVRVDAVKVLKGNLSAAAPLSIAVFALQQFSERCIMHQCSQVCAGTLSCAMHVPTSLVMVCAADKLLCCSGRVGNATHVQGIQQGSCQV